MEPSQRKKQKTELNARQKEAVEYAEGPLLVLAGPGTGKTQLLSEKVAYILKNIDANAENILCLTFTDTGARNMRERLKAAIGRDALKVTIGTYHTFGMEILSQYRGYAENYGRKFDGAIDEVMQHKIVKKIQEGLNGMDILHGDSVKDIVDTISEAKLANLTAEDLAKIAAQNTEDAKVLSETISPFLLQVVPRKYQESYERAYAPIHEILQKSLEGGQLVELEAREWQSEPPQIERLNVVMMRDLEQALEEAAEKKSVAPLSEWKDGKSKGYFEKDNRGNYRLKVRVANKKLASLANVMRQYEEYLRENGLYDFDDMIHEAVRVLRTDAGFKATLQERYQYIMLDEFQDTNPAQLAIVKELTDYEKPLVMAVGDDDQAIYAFQGASASNLADFAEYYGAKKVTLTENYRSTQEILDFAYAVMDKADDRYDKNKKLHANRSASEQSQIYRYEFNSSDMEYGFVADKIAELVRSGVKQSEIAVISAKHKYFEPLLSYLKARPELKIAYEKRDNLLEDEQIHEILTVAKYAYEIANEKRVTVQIMEVLSYPFWRLSILEVLRLVNAARAAHKPAFEYLAENGSEQMCEVMKFLADLAAKSLTEPLEVMLDYIIGTAELNGYRSPFLRFYTGVMAEGGAEQSSDEKTPNDAREYRTFVLYENLAALRGAVVRHYGERRLTLADLVEMVDDYAAAEKLLPNSSPYRDADEAVQILTAHSSKGLEFKYVFILSADHVAWGAGKGNNNLLALPKNLVRIRHTGMTPSEQIRLLFVALTRAKQTLYITNSLHDFNNKAPDRLEYFDESVQNNEAGEEEIISPYLPSGKVQQMYETPDWPTREENLKNWLATYWEESPDMRAIYRERVDGFKMSTSALTGFIDLAYGGPMMFFKDYILRAPREPEDEVLAYGNLIHKTFEQITKAGIDDAEAVAYFLEELSRRDLPSEVVQKLREKGPVALGVALDKFGGILREGEAEVDFYGEKIVIDGVPVTGKIDHIVVDEAKKTIKIYDFKTGAYRKEQWKKQATLYKYWLQLLFYKMLLNNSAKYRKYKVEQGSILYVTPDNDGEVYEKVYEYNEADEAEFLQILKAVYNEIVTLKFMDEPEMMVQPDKQLGIKDILQFVELILERNAR